MASSPAQHALLGPLLGRPCGLGQVGFVCYCRTLRAVRPSVGGDSLAVCIDFNNARSGPELDELTHAPRWRAVVALLVAHMPIGMDACLLPLAKLETAERKRSERWLVEAFKQRAT